MGEGRGRAGWLAHNEKKEGDDGRRRRHLPLQVAVEVVSTCTQLCGRRRRRRRQCHTAASHLFLKQLLLLIPTGLGKTINFYYYYLLKFSSDCYQFYGIQ